MSDSKPGSKTWKKAMKEKVGRVWLERSKKGYWAAGGAAHVEGYGQTIEEAYVDHVEEYWFERNKFPRGYPE